jgi:hypothetical protein
VCANHQHLPVVLADLVHQPEAGIEVGQGLVEPHHPLVLGSAPITPSAQQLEHALAVARRQDVREGVDSHWSSPSHRTSDAGKLVSVIPYSSAALIQRSMRRIKILTSPAMRDPRGRTRAWQAQQARAEAALRRRGPRPIPGQLSLDQLAGEGGLADE